MSDTHYTVQNIKLSNDEMSHHTRCKSYRFSGEDKTTWARLLWKGSQTKAARG